MSPEPEQEPENLPDAKERLDVLVQRAAGVTRSKAQGMIHTGQVASATGERLDKPGVRYPVDTELLIAEPPRFVSRGGDKLAAALEAFAPPIHGLVAMDVGASTGGFTDCMLQHGVGKVYAIDVGYGQLAWKLRQDERVVVMDRCNIRRLRPEKLAEAPDFFTVDCSFISLRQVLPAIVRLVDPMGTGIVLIKPQFEAGQAAVGKGGVVRSPEVHARVVEEVGSAAAELGFDSFDVIPSPLLGPAGNREFLAYLRRSTPFESHTAISDGASRGDA